VIFVDTAAFYALADAADPNHAAARAELEHLRAADAALVTHEYVLVETTALIQRRLGLTALRLFVDGLLPVIEVIWVDAHLHAEAREALLAASRRDVSLVDWTSFLLMRRHGIAQAFSFDADFAAEGFEVIPHP
jgi:predicted nucleic acid-binding protein